MNYKDLTHKQLKEEFIKWFGEAKWKEEEILAQIIKEELFLTLYTDLEPIPVIFEPLKDAYAKFMVNEGYIVLSEDLINYPIQKVLESFLHEYAHYIQVNAVLDCIDKPIVEIWGKELKTKYDFNSSTMDYYLSPLEIGANALTQAMLQNVYEVPYTSLAKEIQSVVDEYKKKTML